MIKWNEGNWEMYIFGWVAVIIAAIDFITAWSRFRNLDVSAGRADSLEGTCWVIAALICFK